jgi:broad specificity phosphatase PhoE
MQPEHASVLLLRHGQSEWNAVKRWQGTADSPLSDLGRSQARATGDRLVHLGVAFAGVWASDLVRAGETASIIAERLHAADRVASTAVTTDERLREAHAGEWQGMTPDEIERRYPGWLDEHRRPDSFEPYDEVVARATAAMIEIGDAVPHGRPALVVSHSGLIRSLIRSSGIVDPRIPNLGGIWATVPRSLVDHIPAPRGVSVGDLFDPGDIVISGIDAPGEDPGDQPHETHADRSAQG